METSDKRLEAAIINRLKAQYPDLDIEDFMPNSVTENETPPMEANGDENKPQSK